MLAMVGQICPECMGARSEHHIVHGGLERRLHELEVVEGRRTEGDGSPNAQRAVEEGSWSVERTGHGMAVVSACGDLAHDVSDGTQRSSERSDPAERTRHPRRHRADEQLRLVGQACRCVESEFLRVGWQRFEIDDLGHDVGSRSAVDGDVVNLGDERDRAVGEPFDHDHFPQRLGVIESRRCELADPRLEVAGGRRSPEVDLSHVVGGIEVGIVGPHRMVEPER